MVIHRSPFLAMVLALLIGNVAEGAAPVGPLSVEEEVAAMRALSLGAPPTAAEVDLHLQHVDPADFDIPVVVTAEVQAWMRFFLDSGRPIMASWRGRLKETGPSLQAEITKAGLPRDTIFLAMIESGFERTAVSRSGALGVWQFMPATAQDFGLIDGGGDHRSDLKKSTAAAAKYLTELAAMFGGDWKLAFAAYNGGQGTVLKAVEAARSTDLRDLSPYLSEETNNYVPKLLAAAIINRYAARYGFEATAPSTH